MSESKQLFISISKNIDVPLQPSWLGKIQWSHGLPLSPEKFKEAKDKIIDYWDNYKNPIWDDMFEYRKLFSNNNTQNNNLQNYYSHNNNLEYISINQDNTFITISKNKKTKIKQYKLSANQLIEYSKNIENNDNNDDDNNYDNDNEYYDKYDNNIESDISDLEFENKNSCENDYEIIQ